MKYFYYLSLFLITFLVATFSAAKTHAQITGQTSQQRTDSNIVTTRIGTGGVPGGGVVPPAPNGYEQSLKDNFGITFEGFDNIHLEWIWEKLNEINSPGFTELLRGSRVVATNGISSKTAACFDGNVTLELGQYPGEEFYKFIIMHEFGHIVQTCQPRRKSKYVEHANALATEGPISWYAANASCTGSNAQSEDYADMIAYYYNPGASFTSASTSCNPPTQTDPYTNGGFPLHKVIAESVI